MRTRRIGEFAADRRDDGIAMMRSVLVTCATLPVLESIAAAADAGAASALLEDHHDVFQTAAVPTAESVTGGGRSRFRLAGREADMRAADVAMSTMIARHRRS